MEKVKVQTKTSREDFMNQTGVIKEVEAMIDEKQKAKLLKQKATVAVKTKDDYLNEIKENNRKRLEENK